MHATSRTWVSARATEKVQRQALNFARRKVCPHSPFWCADFDLTAHRRDWEADLQRRVDRSLVRTLDTLSLTQKPRQLRAPFDGKTFKTNHSNVLSRPTIFCSQWQNGKEDIAPWPSESEAKYEGHDRISTVRLHRRFPGTPRVEANDTVSWQHRAVIEQFPFDDFYWPIPQAVDVFLRTHWVAELEFSDDEGKAVLGEEFMKGLDSRDQ